MAANDIAMPSASDRILVDDITGMTFVAVPATDSFRRGSRDDDPDRLPDEIQGQPVAIHHVYLATTEITHAGLAPYWESVKRNLHDDELNKSLFALQFGAAPSEERARIANAYFDAARATNYCSWLNAQADGKSPKRTYRLPTEDEWEYAARGGNDARFCYGDDAAYADFFASCNGEVQGFHLVARHMPNAYGLFDMHGGLWELTSSTYPSEFADPAHSGLDLVTIRGGAYYNPARRCRSAQRNYAMPDQPGQYTGMRLVMEIEP